MRSYIVWGALVDHEKDNSATPQTQTFGGYVVTPQTRDPGYLEQKKPCGGGDRDVLLFLGRMYV